MAELERTRQSGTRRLAPAIGLLFFALLLTGCASPSGSPPGAQAQETGFDPAVQQELIEQQKQRGAAGSTPEEPAPQTVSEMLREGDALRSDGAYASAMWIYLQAHELDLNDPEPIARMGSLHLTVDPRRAESIFRDLMETHPESSAARTGLALTLIERDEWEEARDMLEESIRLNPNSAVAYSTLGVAQDRLGEYAEAREAYRRATELQPRYYEALNNLGVSYLTTEEFIAAEEVLQKAAREESRDPAVFNNLGLALGRMELYDEALKAFQQAGTEQAARNNLGYVCFLNGHYDRAIEEYEKALHASGDQKLLVLRNLRVARQAEKDLEATDESRSEVR